MLWYKSWLEIRIRLAICVAGILLVSWISLREERPRIMENARHPLAAQRLEPAVRQSLAQHSTDFNYMWLIFFNTAVALVVPLFATVLAGTGINTQTSYGMRQGIHPSTQYTLSLPVSRAQLFASRVGVGWLAVFTLLLVSFASLPFWARIVHVDVSFLDIAPLALCALAGSIAFFHISTFVSVFVDEMWQSFTAYAIIGALYYLFTHVPSLAPYSFFRLMSGELYLLHGGLPLAPIFVCLLLAAMLHLATLQFLKRREF